MIKVEITSQRLWTIIGLCALISTIWAAPFYKAAPPPNTPSCDIETMLTGMDSYGDVTVHRFAYSDYWKDRVLWWATLKTDKSTGALVEFRETGTTVCEAVSNLHDKVSNWPLNTKKQ